MASPGGGGGVWLYHIGGSTIETGTNFALMFIAIELPDI